MTSEQTSLPKQVHLSMATVWQKGKHEGVRRGRALGAEMWILSFTSAVLVVRLQKNHLPCVCCNLLICRHCSTGGRSSCKRSVCRYCTSVMVLQKWLSNFIGLDWIGSWSELTPLMYSASTKKRIQQSGTYFHFNIS